MHTCETAFECFLREVYRSPEGYTSRSTNSPWVLQVWKNCEYLKQLRSPRKLRILANFGNPERLDSSENVEQTRTTRKRTTQKGNVGNIEDATQLQKAKST